MPSRPVGPPEGAGLPRGLHSGPMEQVPDVLSRGDRFTAPANRPARQVHSTTHDEFGDRGERTN
ncbi:hypothetical protein GCM10010230_25050 [Streptomyces narbonensis]|nr:hypothetical protein GCM10010230_25050 [Streptomyces narbonensis]